VALVMWTLGWTLHSSSVLRNTVLLSSDGEETAATVAVALENGQEYEDDDDDDPSPSPLIAAAGVVSPVVPKHRKIPQHQAVMLHVGKAGGGTFDLRTRQWWHVTLEKTCHPQPCLHASYDLARVNETTVFISVRDPVDRYVSAFYWRLQLWCRSNSSHYKETRIAGGPATRFPDQYCGHYRPAEREVLFTRYRENANLLAESLCNDNGNDNNGNDDNNTTEPHHRNSNATMEQAAKDVRLIGHLLASLFHWLGPDWRKKSETLFPIVLERGSNFSFESQIDEGMRYLQSHSTVTSGSNGGGIIDANPVDFQKRQDYVDYMDRLVVQQQQQQPQPANNNKNSTTSTMEPETLTAVEQIQKFSHSSTSTLTKNNNSSHHDEHHQHHMIRMIPLSARGERCVARYYERDYQIIRDLSLYACKTTTCRTALQSIIRRRAHLLGWEEE
jgi:hypothetical protein